MSSLSRASPIFNLRARSGYEGEAGLKLQVGDSIRLSDFPCLQQVMSTQESLLIPDTQAYPGWQTLITHASVGSWLGIPLVAGGQAIGVLALQNTEPDFFNTKHIGLAEGICRTGSRGDPECLAVRAGARRSRAAAVALAPAGGGAGERAALHRPRAARRSQPVADSAQVWAAPTGAGSAPARKTCCRAWRSSNS